MLVQQQVCSTCSCIEAIYSGNQNIEIIILFHQKEKKQQQKKNMQLLYPMAECSPWNLIHTAIQMKYILE